MTDVLERSTEVRPAEPRRRSRPAQSRKYRPDIEGMRAFAVIAVVLYHAGLGVRGGFIGVDVFFVISGFLITRQLLDSVGTRGIRALPGFYTRRIRRLLPAGAVVVVATVLAARWWAPALQVRSVATDGIFTTFYGLNYRLAVEGTQYLHQNDAVSPLQHFWSLAVEEQFYVCWPVLIVLVAAIGRRYRNVLLFFVLTATVVVSFHYSMTVTDKSASWAYFSLHTRAWELALGALVALGASRLARLPRRIAAFGGWAAFIVMLGSAFVFSGATHYPGSAAAYPVVAAATLIACGCGPRRGVERVLAEPLLQCIGRVSYSWYLWHWPMLILAPMIVGHPLTWIGRLGIVWLSLVTAVVSYFLIENPMRRMGRANWQGFLTGFAISGAVLAAGVLVIANPPSFVGSGAATRLVQADSASAGVLTSMRQAVAAGVDIAAAPRNLSPSADKAAHDLPVADGTNCHADFLTIKQGSCVYGDPAGTHTVVLLGDSHADMWLGAFAEAGRAAHWKVVDWTKSSCPAADITVFSSSLNRTYTECDTWRHDVEAR
ncbi:MAG: acyltransferase 3, partial [Pseudonocardiales bacterium]|nr:acyltransferase 3 [Pseudonocardiales bacterium]